MNYFPEHRNAGLARLNEVLVWRPSNGACFDQTRNYRYQLWRTWNPLGHRILFVMLNPSNADESVNDPTIRRCIAYAKAWEFGGMEVCNMFAYRSSNPVALLNTPDPVGSLNDAHIEQACKMVKTVVIAWGAHQFLRSQDRAGMMEVRERKVKEMISRHTDIYCLKKTADLHPRHPLYLKSSLRPSAY